MANAPPTPPATTPIELQDEARTNAAMPESSSASASVNIGPPSSQNVADSRPEIYQSMIPAIIDSIARNDYRRLVRIAEEMDYNTASDRQPSRLLIIAPLVLGYLVLDDTSPARYALSRVAESIAHLPLSRALMTLVVATINREHAKVYDQTKVLLNLVSQPDFADKELASIITALLSAFIDAFRHRTFKLLSKAYTSLQLDLACSYLGWPQADVISVAQKNGWSYDGPNQIFHPVTGGQPKIAPSKFSSLKTFHFVADSVAALEI